MAIFRGTVEEKLPNTTASSDASIFREEQNEPVATQPTRVSK